MKKLLLLMIIFIGCLIISCSDTNNELIIEKTLKTKSDQNYTDSTATTNTTDTTSTNIKIVVDEWGDTISTHQEF